MRIEPSILNAINESNSAEENLWCALSFFFARRKKKQDSTMKSLILAQDER